MLELKGLSYQVEDTGAALDILQDIDLTIEDNKLVVITGPNGGGKTTLAKAVMGLVKPTSGQILWNGQDITELSITERARLGISYGFQQPPRFKGLRVRDLLELASGKAKLTRDQCCSYLTGWASAPPTTWTGMWTPPSPAARSSASRSPPSWPGPRAAC